MTIIKFKKHTKNINFSIKYIDMFFFQLQNLQCGILQNSNHLKELFFINVFPLDILNQERN